MMSNKTVKPKRRNYGTRKPQDPYRHKYQPKHPVGEPYLEIRGKREIYLTPSQNVMKKLLRQWGVQLAL
jgi:hypothetical protein